MPEGPEIHRAAAQIARALSGRKAERVFFAFDSLKPFEGMLEERKVDSVRARGKAILIAFEGGLTIYSHNQLYGKWFVRKRDLYPHTARQLRFAIHTADHSALLYSASDIEVLDEKGLSIHAYLTRLGPDVLDADVQYKQILEQVKGERFRRRQLGTLLLDQGFLAGLGNYLRSEILFDAGLHPKLRPADCDDAQLRRLAKRAFALSRRSYRTGGVTNDPERVRALKKKGKRRSEYRFMVFARAGRSCYRCRSRIQKLESNSRRLYLCPNCQPAPISD
jgi:endonuclease-8